jgi:hypothetical protein
VKHVLTQALVHEQPLVYMPSTGADAGGRGLGPAWVTDAAVAVTHPAPTNSFGGQFRCTRFTSPAVANKGLGVFQNNADGALCWRGDAASRGGFYFAARFRINAIPDFAIRLFVGLSALTGAAACSTNFVPQNSVGLFLDTGRAGSLCIGTNDSLGGQQLNELKLSNGSYSPHTIVVGTIYEFVIIQNPTPATTPGTIVTLLYDLTATASNGLIRTQNMPDGGVGSVVPDAGVFMAPQCMLGNAAHAAGGDCSFDVLSVYARPNQRLLPGLAV